MSRLQRLAAASIAAVFFSGQLFAAAVLDPNLPEYSSTGGVSGTISSAGSSTMSGLMSGWADAFTRLYPNAHVQIQSAGSATAAGALIEGSADIGAMSRKMAHEELAAFTTKFGYKPVAIPVALDALTVYVHKDNPLKGLNLPQLDAIFSSTLKCGYAEEPDDWAQLGVEGPLGGKNIRLFGYATSSGTRDFFRERALCDGDFRNALIAKADGTAVVQAVAASIDGIGYAGMGYGMSGVRAVPLARKEGQPYIAASTENTLIGKYPLARFLYIYVNKQPDKPLAPLQREFIKMLLSQTGQEEVVKKGYIPLPANLVARELARLE